jgi:transcriptional regulator with XRE-family HTH domain
MVQPTGERKGRTTPKRAGRVARKGSLFPSEVLAKNMRAIRSLNDLTQGDVAARIAEFGHPWHQSTVGHVERGTRTVSTDELFALAACLQTTVAKLLDPQGLEDTLHMGIDLGGEKLPSADPDLARLLILPEDDPWKMKVSESVKVVWIDNMAIGFAHHAPPEGMLRQLASEGIEWTPGALRQTDGRPDNHKGQ